MCCPLWLLVFQHARQFGSALKHLKVPFCHSSKVSNQSNNSDVMYVNHVKLSTNIKSPARDAGGKIKSNQPELYVFTSETTCKVKAVIRLFQSGLNRKKTYLKI